MNPDIADRAVAAYLGLAIGDALGATVEFLTPREIRARHGTHRDIVGGGWLQLRAGQVTDDTTMALALGDAILAADGEVRAEDCARAFDAWMRAKPVDIGNTVCQGILHWRRTGEACVPENEYGAGNGAAMRLLPVAIATLGQSEEAVAAACLRQAHVTHNNALSDAACITLTLMVQDLLDGKSVVEVLHRRAHLLDRQWPQFAFRCRQVENPSGYIVDSLKAVFQAFFDSDDFEDCLIDVVNRGGDADTTGAIAGMLAGARFSTRAIPPRWLAALDGQVRRACTRQAEALLNCARRGQGDGRLISSPPARAPCRRN